MKKYAVLISALAVCSFMSAAVAGQRFVVHSAPVMQYHPQIVHPNGNYGGVHYNISPGVHYNGNAGMHNGFVHQGVVGIHGRPMVVGARREHEMHNHSFLRASLPAAAFGYAGDQQVDLEEFIEGIDTSSAIEPTTPCYTNCLWAVISYATNGASGSIVAQPTEMDARKQAYWSCMSVANGNPCPGWSSAVGTMWIVALYCQHTDDYGNSTWNTIAHNGDTFGAATRNAYRTAAAYGFSIDDCGLINAVSADGSQGQYAQLE